MSAGSQIGIQHDTLVHTRLDTKVEHSLFFAIINTAYTSQVTLLVVGSYTLYYIGRQVLHSGLGITNHELFTIHHNLLHLFTIDRNLAVIVNLGTWQSLYQFLNHGAFRGTEGSSIIDKGIGLQRHLGSLTCHRCTLQHHGIRLHVNLTQSYILVS